jgi:CheY-like chemotaxis protein
MNVDIVSPKTGTGKILCVDDDPDILMVLQSALGTYGYETVLAHDGEEGVRVFKERKKELVVVILDLRMPVKNGFEAAKEIRADSPDVILIALSAYLGGQKKDAFLTKDCDQPLFNACATKPFSIEQLVTTIQTCIQKQADKVMQLDKKETI